MSTAPYQDSRASVEERVSDLLARMSVEQKVGQMMQLPANRPGMMDRLEEQHIGSFLHCTGSMMRELQERAEKMPLGIPLIFGIDAIHGHCFEPEGTVFPTQLAAACSWDRAAIHAMGRVTAREVRASGIHWTFSPVLCVGRDPRWGRMDETFGEDPWLIGELAADLIAGYQGLPLPDGDRAIPPAEELDFGHADAILACAKHYAAYGESTGGRDAYEAEVSRRKMLSLFLPPFEKAARRAHCATLMAGYQTIDGLPCSANPWLLREVPKQRWEMDGFIVTDWNNVGSLHQKQNVAESTRDAAYLAILAGNDMIMSTPEFYEDTLALVEEGRIDPTLIDDSVSRILRAKFRLGLFDTMRHSDEARRAKVVGAPEHHETALEVARKTPVLLKNEPAPGRALEGDAPVLPLDPSEVKHLLVTGPNADNVVAQLGDWSFGSMQAGATNESFHRAQTTTVLDGIAKRAETAGIAVDHVPGVPSTGRDPGDPFPKRVEEIVNPVLSDEAAREIERARVAAEKADVVIAVVGDSLRQHGEFRDRGLLRLGGGQEELIATLAATGKPLVVVYLASKPLAIRTVRDNAHALLCAFNPGEAGGTAIAEVLFGDVNPCGKLPVSFPVHEGQLPVYYNKYGGWHATNESGVSGAERYIDLPSEPLFAFGEGMSYTRFAYSELRIENPLLKRPDPMTGAAGPELTVSVTVHNTGERAGAEVVQLYIRDVVSSVTRPLKELRAFERVEIAAGESERVTLRVPFDELALVDQDLVRRVEPGEFEVMVGSSSRDRDLLRDSFRVE
ncbi:MAG: glycoside hydrolase family 3 N-terminal domain-containing protein [Spirochaetota bacterium]